MWLHLASLKPWGYNECPGPQLGEPKQKRETKIDTSSAEDPMQGMSSSIATHLTTLWVHTTSDNASRQQLPSVACFPIASYSCCILTGNSHLLNLPMFLLCCLYYIYLLVLALFCVSLRGSEVYKVGELYCCAFTSVSGHIFYGRSDRQHYKYIW